MTLRALIFDCDGTLVDSEAPGLDVLCDFAAAHGLTWDRDEAHARFRGVPLSGWVEGVARESGRYTPAYAVQLERELRDAMAERFHEGLDTMPGAHELLRQLALPYCVATNGPREKVELTLTLTGLRPLFGDRVFCAPEVGSYKPEPGLFLHAARALGVDPAHCAVVEDSLPGAEAGLAAGMRVFGLQPHDEPHHIWPADVTLLRRLDDLLPFLTETGTGA